MHAPQPLPTATPEGCYGCRHLTLLHDPGWPYACRRFEIRSRRLPSLEIEASSGRPCEGRELREAASGGSASSPW